MSQEHIKNANETGAQVRTMLVGLLGMESRPDNQKAFDYDLNFNINTLFLAVASANKIKLETAFIPAYKDQLKYVKSKADSDSAMVAETIAGLLIVEQNKLP